MKTQLIDFMSGSAPGQRTAEAVGSAGPGRAPNEDTGADGPDGFRSVMESVSGHEPAPPAGARRKSAGEAIEIAPEATAPAGPAETAGETPGVACVPADPAVAQAAWVPETAASSASPEGTPAEPAENGQATHSASREGAGDVSRVSFPSHPGVAAGSAVARTRAVAPRTGSAKVREAEAASEWNRGSRLAGRVAETDSAPADGARADGAASPADFSAEGQAEPAIAERRMQSDKAPVAAARPRRARMEPQKGTGVPAETAPESEVVEGRTSDAGNASALRATPATGETQRENGPASLHARGPEPVPASDPAGFSQETGAGTDGSQERATGEDRTVAALQAEKGDTRTRSLRDRDARATILTRTEPADLSPSGGSPAGDRVAVAADVAPTVTLGAPAQNSGPAASSETVESWGLRAGVLDQFEKAARSMLRAGRQEAEIQLEPPELGRIYVRLSVQDSRVQAFVEVHNPAVKAALESDVSRLTSALAETGLDLSQFDVSVADGRAQQSRGQSSDLRGTRRVRGADPEDGTVGRPTAGRSVSGGRLVDYWF